MTGPRPRPGRRSDPGRTVVTRVEDLPVLCTCAEAGQLLRLNPEVVQKMAKAGTIKGAKQGKGWVFRREDLVAYIDRLFAAG